jgi:alpha-L-glutamate ligase-like protein
MINFKKLRQFLTKNERNKVYLRKNKRSARLIADNKLKTKSILSKNGINVPRLIAKFRKINDLENFRWETLDGNFVIKPSMGYGGDGIIIVRRRGKYAGEWVKMDGEIITSQDIWRHCQEILAGKYSLHNTADHVIVEERIKIHPMFLSITKTGTPDIRVIIYNRVPVMAMFRIPTEKSGGKANLQQGAIGLGIDLATGITTFGIEGKGTIVKRIYDYGKKKLRKVNGIKIPMWKEIMEISVKCQEAMSGLGFMGVDVVLDKEKGPTVLEVNARPGLSIQVCNRAGLKNRMDKVEEIDVRSVNHAITLSKYLFGEKFFEKVEEKEKMRTVGPLETIRVKLGKGKKNYKEVKAKIDTGAFRSSIDRKLAEELGLLREEKILYYRHYRSALGKNIDRPVIGLTFWLKDRKIITAVNVADRKKLRTKFLLGRKDLEGFLIKAKN